MPEQYSLVKLSPDEQAEFNSGIDEFINGCTAVTEPFNQTEPEEAYGISREEWTAKRETYSENVSHSQAEISYIDKTTQAAKMLGSVAVKPLKLYWKIISKGVNCVR